MNHAKPAWPIYTGGGTPHDGIDRLPKPPPWRNFSADGAGAISRHIGEHRTATFRPDQSTVEAVNAAIFLRRPLLVSGTPGSGKSTLAYSIAHELGLRDVLHWPITSRSTLAEGLYQYDAIGRLQDTRVEHPDEERRDATFRAGRPIGDYIRLGPLGTALLSEEGDKPRVLLIDELDKCDVDLPNDLLNVFEEGTFVIPELERASPDRLVDGKDGTRRFEVYTADTNEKREVIDGRVSTRVFPIVVMTSNNEREFPWAFQRRCLRVRLEAPSADRLAAIVEAHLGEVDETAQDRIDWFLGLQQDEQRLAIDQLLNVLYLGRTPGIDWSSAQFDSLRETLTTKMGTEPGRANRTPPA
ncbi:AAA family ATPase [Dactylosporangium siamense]|uniref:ATPase AAA n=1 Tax=Dactylosporangium siamense TaxID=685454 RepID=A0A919PUN5_9ACTN|nr:MoxR family ATPase [Dactylosporangium siamense]GIG50527.1 ATPase AAA [Dactylosporangium siamense]